MDLERGMLARIDRKLLSGLGQSETYRMVRVPVTAAKWSTWKRYCDSAGISMGRAIAAMIDRELVSVFGDSAGGPALPRSACHLHRPHRTAGYAWVTDLRVANGCGAIVARCPSHVLQRSRR